MKGYYRDWLSPEKLNLIRNWKMNGLTDDEVAHNIGISRSTLYEWKNRFSDFSDAFKTGKAEANAIVENKLFQKAISGNMTAIIFYLKNNLRSKYNDSTLSEEERDQVKQKCRKLKAEADLAEYKANLIAHPDKIEDKTIIIDDIGGTADDKDD